MDLSPLDPVFCLSRLRGLLGLVSNTSLLRDMQDHFTEGWPFLSVTVANYNSFRDFLSRIFRSNRLTQAMPEIRPSLTDKNFFYRFSFTPSSPLLPSDVIFQDTLIMAFLAPQVLQKAFNSLPSHILLSSSSAHSNSVLTFPNNIYRHACYCLSNIKQFKKYKQ